MRFLRHCILRANVPYAGYPNLRLAIAYPFTGRLITQPRFKPSVSDTSTRSTFPLASAKNETDNPSLHSNPLFSQFSQSSCDGLICLQSFSRPVFGGDSDSSCWPLYFLLKATCILGVVNSESVFGLRSRSQASPTLAGMQAQAIETDSHDMANMPRVPAIPKDVRKRI